jgi:hypothetical protein
VRKSGLILSAVMTGALVVSIVVNIHLYIVSKQLNDELSELRQINDQLNDELSELRRGKTTFEIHGHIYAPWGFENETQEYAPTLWNKVKDFDEVKSVVSEKNFSVIVYMHPYSVGVFGPSTAEWVVIVSSIPEMANKVKIAIFRFDYWTCDVKKTYEFDYPVADELTLEESIAVITEEMTKDPSGSRPVNSGDVKLLGGNYVCSYPPIDFGGTIIVNKYARNAIFYATAVWGGTGRLLIPED